MKFADEIIQRPVSGETLGGFNARLYDESHHVALSGIPSGTRWAHRHTGWELADEMIREGKIYSLIQIGAEDIYIEFKCFKDGNQWCCVGPDFTNLQESTAAFGDTRGQAIKAYSLIRKIK